MAAPLLNLNNMLRKDFIMSNRSTRFTPTVFVNRLVPIVLILLVLLVLVLLLIIGLSLVGVTPSA